MNEFDQTEPGDETLERQFQRQLEESKDIAFDEYVDRLNGGESKGDEFPVGNRQNDERRK